MTDKEKILKYLEFKGVSKNKFYIKTGLSVGFLDSGSSLGVDKLKIIIDNYPDFNSDWLLTGEGSMLKSSTIEEKKTTTTSIPLLPIDAAAGMSAGDLSIATKDIIDGYVIPEFTQKGVEYIIRVSGSSMYPKYSSGDLLGCKRIKDTSFFQWGKVYVLDTDQGAMVKRLFPGNQEDSIECRSDNKDYPPFFIHKSSIYNISIVVGVLRME